MEGVSGELIRQNITDTEKGIPLTFNILTLDHKTCKPLAGEWVEIWSVNGTVRAFLSRAEYYLHTCRVSTAVWLLQGMEISTIYQT